MKNQSHTPQWRLLQATRKFIPIIIQHLSPISSTVVIPANIAAHKSLMLWKRLAVLSWLGDGLVSFSTRGNSLNSGCPELITSCCTSSSMFAASSAASMMVFKSFLMSAWCLEVISFTCCGTSLFLRANERAISRGGLWSGDWGKYSAVSLGETDEGRGFLGMGGKGSWSSSCCLSIVIVDGMWTGLGLPLRRMSSDVCSAIFPFKDTKCPK